MAEWHLLVIFMAFLMVNSLCFLLFMSLLLSGIQRCMLFYCSPALFLAALLPIIIMFFCVKWCCFCMGDCWGEWVEAYGLGSVFNCLCCRSRERETSIETPPQPSYRRYSTFDSLPDYENISKTKLDFATDSSEWQSDWDTPPPSYDDALRRIHYSPPPHPTPNC